MSSGSAALCADADPATYHPMLTEAQLATLRRSEAWRMTKLVTGMLLLMATPIVGVLPGPGGVVLFAAGMALLLQNSRWVRRRYVRFKRWQPAAGRWADWGLRRQSARRREALRKAAKQRRFGAAD